MRSYECMVIADPALDEDQLSALVERLSGIITTAGGSLEKTDSWGKRRLAYPIDGKTEGQYVLLHFQAEHAATQELERIMRITDGVVRYLLVRKDED